MRGTYRHILLLLTICFGLLAQAFLPIPTHAQTHESPQSIPLTSPEERFEAEVLKVIESKTEKLYGTTQTIQTLRMKALTGSKKGSTFTLTNGGAASSSISFFKEHDRLIIASITQPNGQQTYFVVDYVRRSSLAFLGGLFVIVVLGVTGKKGVAALIAMTYSFIIIFQFVLPYISKGAPPILIAIVGGMLIIPVTFYVSHGFNTKTHVAILGTLVSLVITGLLAEWAIESTHLTGFASEDAQFVQLMSNGTIHIKGLLLAGILVGLFGILDDVTVSQASIVQQLKEASPSISGPELYKRAMAVGKDHIGSLINTLILVYAGAALPFMLLLTSSSTGSLATSINYEIIAEEIVRTLAASIGLILAVPITTLIAARKWSD